MLKSRTDGTARVLQPLLAYPDPEVRLSAAMKYREVDRDASLAVATEVAKRRDKVGEGARGSLRRDERIKDKPDAPPKCVVPHESWFRWTRQAVPTGLSVHALTRRLREAFPTSELAERLLGLARRSIGIWPQRLGADAAPTASRLGGLPSVPAGWSWPTCASEPLFFLGHINCADLTGLPTAASLPRRGLIAFFGDHDWVNGCFPEWDPQAAVYYWPDIETLAPAPAPIEDFTILPACALSFFETLDLPHPLSDAVWALALSDSEARRYDVTYHNLSAQAHGVREDRYQMDITKMFGWPDLIQGDLENMERNRHRDGQLLFQLGNYDNGIEVHGWGPGGVLHFVIDKTDLAAAARSNRVDSDMQCT